MILGETQKFVSPEEALKNREMLHYGVKGMRWGVRKEDNTGGVDAARRNEGLKTALIQDIAANSAATQTPSLGHGNPHFELLGKDSLIVDQSKGYSDIRPASGFANAEVAQRHKELTKMLDQMRDQYPSVARMNIEVVPMSRVPDMESVTSSAFASVLGIKKGEVRVMYNDVLGKLSPEQAEMVNYWMPGNGKKDYLGAHEMGHVLAVAHGTMPPGYDTITRGRNKDFAKWIKTSEAQHAELLKKHGLPFSELSKLSPYAATKPSEALGELSGYYHSSALRSQLSPEVAQKAKALFDELGGAT